MTVKNIVLVHGAWADGSSWSKLIPLLQAKGLHVAAVQNPLSSLAADVGVPTAPISAKTPSSRINFWVLAIACSGS